MISPLTPLEFLARSAYTWRDSIAVVEGARKFTYREMAERVERQSAALAALGVTAGDRVAVLSPNSAMALEAHFAPMRIGAVVVMLNTRLAAGELEWILKHCGAKVLLVDPALKHLIANAGVAHVIDDYEAFLASTDGVCPAVPVIDENACIAITYTSGTTGFPKGVMFTHRGAWVNAVGEITEYGLDQRSVYLWTLPMFHCNGWCFTWAVTAAGGRHICIRQPDAAEETGAEICHAYGLTETYGPHTVCSWKPEWDTLPANERAMMKARQGVPYMIAGMDLRVADSHMKDVPADGETMGEVLMRGNNVMLGYYDNPKATAEALEGGWFHSGDLAVVHPDGYIEIRDRKKDIVISGGENISSIEVEKVLADHPAVAEVAIVAAPHAQWGEVPKAYVGLKPGMQATSEELIGWCRERLSHFKCPKLVEFGPLPRTATGKIRKNELRARTKESHA